MGLGGGYNMAALVADLYKDAVLKQPDKVLRARIREYNKFQKLPFKQKFLKYITFRDPDRDGYEWSKHELKVRKGKAKPYWFVKEYILDRKKKN